MQLSTSSRQNKWPVFFSPGVPLAVTTLLWWSSPYEVSASQAGAAFILAWIPWDSYRRWDQGEKREIPLFVLIASMFWLSYALPLFWSGHNIALVTGKHQVSDDAVTKSLYLAVMGVLALFAGMSVTGRSRRGRTINLDVPANPSRWNYLRIILVLGILLRLFVPIDLWGPEGRQIIINLETILPAVTFAILFRYFLRGSCSDLDRILVMVYVAIALVVGISSGWLGSFVGLGIVCAAMYIYERHKLPLTAALMMLPLILFFQPAKDVFRNRFWRSDSGGSYAERISFWVNQSWQMWGTAVSDPSGEATGDLAGSTLNRISLLQQTANVMERTPDVVPYQYGRLYSYIAVTLVPRFAWPDKPSVNDANRWYQVSYGLTLPTGLGSVSIAVGTLAESYINFSWFGPLLVMLPLGIFLGYIQGILLRHTSGLLLNSLGVVLLPGFLGIESQLAQYVAGLAQQILIAVVVLAPVLEVRHRQKFGDKRLAQRAFSGYMPPSHRLKARAAAQDRP
jgi:hypothetical protein